MNNINNLKGVIKEYQVNYEHEIIKNTLETIILDFEKFIDAKLLELSITINEFADRFPDSISAEAIDFMVKYMHTLANSKHIAYKDESEYRLVILEAQVQEFINSKLKFRYTKNGTLIDYVPIKLDLDYSLKTIIIHPEGTELQKSSLMKYLKFKTDLKNVNILISDIPYRTL